MYENIQNIAAALSVGQSVAGLVGSLVAVKLLGKWSAAKKSFWTGPVNLLYLLAILVLLFFTHTAGTKLFAGG